MADHETCSYCSRTFLYLSFDQGTPASDYCSEECFVKDTGVDTQYYNKRPSYMPRTVRKSLGYRE